MSLPKIPNGMALCLALKELESTLKLRADLNKIDPDSSPESFLDQFIDELRHAIQEYGYDKPGIHIGDYRLSLFDENSMWIERDGGEGMQVPNTRFIKAIDKLFEDF